MENWGKENATEGIDCTKAGAVKVTDSKVGGNECKGVRMKGYKGYVKVSVDREPVTFLYHLLSLGNH